MQAFDFHRYLRIGSRLIAAIHGDYKPGFRVRNVRIPASYVFSVQIGRGAGYLWGATLFFGRFTGSAKYSLMCRGRYHRATPCGFECGITRNGNRVPYVAH